MRRLLPVLLVLVLALGGLIWVALRGEGEPQAVAADALPTAQKNVKGEEVKTFSRATASAIEQVRREAVSDAPASVEIEVLDPDGAPLADAAWVVFWDEILPVGPFASLG